MLLCLSVNAGDPDLEFQAESSDFHSNLSSQHNYSRVQYFGEFHINKPVQHFLHVSCVLQHSE